MTRSLAKTATPSKIAPGWSSSGASRPARGSVALAATPSAAASLASIPVGLREDAQEYGEEYDSSGTYDDYAQDSHVYGGGDAVLGDAPNARGAVTMQEVFDEVDFNPDGLSEEVVALLNPIDALRALQARDEAFARTAELYPDVGHHNNEADAFRHAFWNYRMSQLMGAGEAKKFGDAHERDSGNAQGETLMDLYNNDVGRSLAVDPAHDDRDPAEVIQEAIASGQLRARPFEVDQP
jgi:hypothetical protein